MRTLLLTVALLLTGCSIVLMERLDDRWTPAKEPRCGTGGVAALDAFIAAGNGVVAVWAYTEGQKLEDGGTLDDGSRESLNRAILIGTAAAAVYAASATVGIVYGSRCQDARDRRDRWLKAQKRP